jgi:SOS-response transcriptional repressor LexA
MSATVDHEKLEKIHRKNLERLIKWAGTARLLALRAGTSSNYLSQVHGTRRKTTSGVGEVRKLGVQVCRKLELAAGKPEGWMDQEHDDEPVGVSAVPSRRVPILSWSDAARVKLMDARELLQKEAIIITIDSSDSPRVFALRVSGEAMFSPAPGTASFPDGSMITVDPDVIAQTLDYVLVKFADKPECVFRQLVHDGIDQHFLKALNPEYNQGGLIAVPADAEIIGVVIGLYQQIVPRSRQR